MSNLKFEHELKHRIAPSSMSGHTELNEPKEGKNRCFFFTFGICKKLKVLWARTEKEITNTFALSRDCSRFQFLLTQLIHFVLIYLLRSFFLGGCHFAALWTLFL